MLAILYDIGIVAIFSFLKIILFFDFRIFIATVHVTLARVNNLRETDFIIKSISCFRKDIAKEVDVPNTFSTRHSY